MARLSNSTLVVVALLALSVGRIRAEGGEEKKSGNGTMRYSIAAFDWPHVQSPMTIVLWLLLASIAKVVFHLSKRLTSIVPDSSLLIVLGLIVGIILFLANIRETKFNLESEVFFLFLLPPIVFEAGYFMPNRAFFDNLGTILVYAVLGTIWNMLTIGFSLYAVGQAGMFSMPTPLLDLLLFTSLISAVDPVAVLVVFEEIHVNEVLFIVVFGESLLNDAVTVVLYKMFQSFAEIGPANIITQDIIFGLLSFLVVALGGVLVGLIWAIVTSFVTRFTKHVQVLQPLFVFIMGYASYLTAEMFHLSGILAAAFCGISMKQYVEGNISQKSHTTIKNFLKTISNSSETIIFMFLGLSTVSTSHHWDTAFVGLTVLFCLVYRAIGTVIQTFFVNKLRTKKLNKVDQFIMAYGGLRGAIAYGLVVALNEEVIKGKSMYVTACIVVIYFTVFLQGMTIKPLVNFLKVKKDEARTKTMNEQLFDRIMDHTLAGMESISKQHGHDWLRSKYEYLNTKYMKPILMREPPVTTDTGIIEIYTKLSMKDAMNMLHKHGNFTSKDKKGINNVEAGNGPSFAAYGNPSYTNEDEMEKPPINGGPNPNSKDPRPKFANSEETSEQSYKHGDRKKEKSGKQPPPYNGVPKSRGSSLDSSPHDQISSDPAPDTRL